MLSTMSACNVLYRTLKVKNNQFKYKEAWREKKKKRKNNNKKVKKKEINNDPFEFIGS